MLAAFEQLPNEVLYTIFLSVPPSTVPILQQVCRKFNGVSQPLLWRHHCRTLFRYWSPARCMQDKFDGDMNKVDWKTIFSERHVLGHQVSNRISDILSEQKGRLTKAEDIVCRDYDAKDALLQNLNVEQTAEDVLARRYYSDAVLGLLHRNVALEEWVKLSKGEHVPLERALVAFDLFVLHGRKGDFAETSLMLDNIAKRFQWEVPTHVAMDTGSKARALASWLRTHNLVGLKGNVNDNYHNMQNNFLGIALEDPAHPSLPLISVALYCCVAHRLDLDAQPCGFPFHVLALVKPSEDLDVGDHGLPERQLGNPIYMDPFRSDSETPLDDLRSRLQDLGIPASDHEKYLTSSSTAEIVRRSAKNIITSVQSGNRNEGMHPSTASPVLETDGAFYSSLWALTILAEGDRDIAERAQFLPYIIQEIESQFPLDVSLIEKFIAPLFPNLPHHHEISAAIRTMRGNDAVAPGRVRRRTLQTSASVRFGVGQHFKHRRYGYFAVVIGWDDQCLAGEAWIARMGVDQLSRGKHQSFYHVKYDFPLIYVYNRVDS